MLQETAVNSMNKKAFSHREWEDIGVRVRGTGMCPIQNCDTPFILAVAGGGFSSPEHSKPCVSACGSLNKNDSHRLIYLNA